MNKILQKITVYPIPMTVGGIVGGISGTEYTMELTSRYISNQVDQPQSNSILVIGSFSGALIGGMVGMYTWPLSIPVGSYVILRDISK